MRQIRCRGRAERYRADVLHHFQEVTKQALTGRGGTTFTRSLSGRGIFLHPHHHGYIAYRHTEEDLDMTVETIDEAMAYVHDKYHRNVYEK